MKNFKLTLCYDGTRYKGWQRQGNTDNTIQEKLERLLSRLLDQQIEAAGSGRTDAGVHARAQVCSFRADTKLTPEQLLREIRAYLPEDIGAVSLAYAPPRFHARLNAAEKTYVYKIWNNSEPDVFERKYRLDFAEPLDLQLMREAAAALCGQHDFTSFCANKHMKKSAVRTIYSITVEDLDGEIRISLTGDGFLYNMVRIIVGTLLEIGTGKRSAASIPDILAGHNRALAGPTAPAKGLFLWDVKYNGADQC